MACSKRGAKCPCEAKYSFTLSFRVSLRCVAPLLHFYDHDWQHPARARRWLLKNDSAHCAPTASARRNDAEPFDCKRVNVKVWPRVLLRPPPPSAFVLLRFIGLITVTLVACMTEQSDQLLSAANCMPRIGSHCCLQRPFSLCTLHFLPTYHLTRTYIVVITAAGACVSVYTVCSLGRPPGAPESGSCSNAPGDRARAVRAQALGEK